MANVNYIGKDLVTPKGEALFAKVNTEIDEFKGKRRYVINVAFNETDEAAMKVQFDKWLTDAKALPENKGKKWRSADDPRIGYRVDEKSGKTLFTFRTDAFRVVNGEEVQKTVPVVDIYGKPINEAIGNGSIVQIQYTPGWYYESKDGNGLSMFLNAIMVHKLVAFGGPHLAFDFQTPDPEQVLAKAAEEVTDPFPE